MRPRVLGNIGRLVTDGCRGSVPRTASRPMGPSGDTSPASRRSRQQFRQPNQIERRTREYEQPVHLREAAQFHLAHPRDRFQRAERRFDARSGMLTHRVARMPRRATVNRAPAGPLEILCDVWGAPQFAHDVNEFADVVGLIRADRPSSPRRALPLRVQHQHARISLRAPVGSVAIASTIKPWRFSISR